MARESSDLYFSEACNATIPYGMYILVLGSPQSPSFAESITTAHICLDNTTGCHQMASYAACRFLKNTFDCTLTDGQRATELNLFQELYGISRNGCGLPNSCVDLGKNVVHWNVGTDQCDHGLLIGPFIYIDENDLVSIQTAIIAVGTDICRLGIAMDRMSIHSNVGYDSTEN